jgi:plasmid stability protein
MSHPVAPSRRLPARAFAACVRCWQNEGMNTVQITIRAVPERVKDELASRAALQGKSMEEFLRAELERIASRPTIEGWLEQVRKRKRASQVRLSARQILEHREADRR